MTKADKPDDLEENELQFRIENGNVRVRVAWEEGSKDIYLFFSRENRPFYRYKLTPPEVEQLALNIYWAQS